jgi:S-formylglutathione hydrolase FrmB
MGRDIPVAVSGGGPHAVYLLEAFDAGDAVSNWVTAGTNGHFDFPVGGDHGWPSWARQLAAMSGDAATAIR